MNILEALKKILEACRTAGIEPELVAQVDARGFFNADLGDVFFWDDDNEYSGNDIESCLDAIEAEEGNVVVMTRQIELPNIFVAVTSESFQAFNTEAEAEAFLEENEATE